MACGDGLNWRKLAAALAPAALLALAACSSVSNATRSAASAMTLYRPEVVQGNFISKEQVQALKTGMTRQQVRDLLGTPLLTSVFRTDRWDYVFTLKRQHVPPQSFRLTVYFKDDALEHFEGDAMPSEDEFAQHIGDQTKPKVPVLQATEEQLNKFPPPSGSGPVAAAAQDTAPPPPGSYPPLEPPASAP
jgi:outer membrane protein assembly factor BamE